MVGSLAHQVTTLHGTCHVQRAGIQSVTKHGVLHEPGTVTKAVNTPSLNHSITPSSLTHSPTHSLTHSLTHTHSFTHSLTLEHPHHRLSQKLQKTHPIKIPLLQYPSRSPPLQHHHFNTPSCTARCLGTSKRKALVWLSPVVCRTLIVSHVCRVKGSLPRKT